MLSLCASCNYQRILKTASGNPIVMCRRSETDPAFAKFPPLPVLDCAGHEKTGAV